MLKSKRILHVTLMVSFSWTFSLVYVVRSSSGSGPTNGTLSKALFLAVITSVRVG